MLPGIEAFELVTSETSTRLPFEGELLGWSDDSSQRVVEHLILNRPGAVHQDQGPQPDRYVFRCLLRDPGAGERRKQIAQRLSTEPFCTMIHPRLGRLPVVYNGLKVSEDMGTMINGLIIELSVTETGLRDEREESASGAARQAAVASAQAATLAAAYPALAPLGTALDSETTAFLGLVEGSTSQYDLATGLQRVRVASEALTLAAGVGVEFFRIVNSARMAYGYVLQSYQINGAALPPIVPKVVPQRMSLARYLRSLYGGGAIEIEAEAMRINHIANPYAMPAGTELLLPDPQAIRL